MSNSPHEIICTLQSIKNKLDSYQLIDNQKKYVDKYSNTKEKYLYLPARTLRLGIPLGLGAALIYVLISFGGATLSEANLVFYTCIFIAFLRHRSIYIQRKKRYEKFLEISRDEFSIDKLETRDRFFEESSYLLGSSFVNSFSVTKLIEYLENGTCTSLDEAKKRLKKENTDFRENIEKERKRADEYYLYEQSRR